jgi:UV DNA damage endonuclease
LTAPYRLGFAVKVLGQGGLKTADTRRWQSGPHVGRSIEYLDAVFDYLDRIDVRVYRMSSQFIPYGTHPDLPQFDFRRQLDQAAQPLADLAAKATRLGLRLSTHPGQYTVLNALDESVVAKAVADVEANAYLLDLMGQPPEAAVVVHVGGAYGEHSAAMDRWVRTWERLSDRARERLALENDEHVFGLNDVLEIHRRTGVRVVLDVHHHRIRESRSAPLAEVIAAASATWPRGQRPKVHLSSASTMLATPPTKGAIAYPQLRGHADLVTPWDLEAVVEATEQPIDIMLEAKAKDLAVLHLRSTLAAVRPHIAALEERNMTPVGSQRPGAMRDFLGCIRKGRE